MNVNPGDLVVDDADGVTVVPRDKLEEALAAAGKKDAYEHNRRETIDRYVLAKALGCQPCTLSFGLGRTACEASSLSLEAMKEGRYDVQNEIEKRITDAVNAANIGPIGLGCKTSVLATFIKVGNMRASGFRVVSMRPNCCMEIRKATCRWETRA